jgi:uncharacterized membrane protein
VGEKNAFCSSYFCGNNLSFVARVASLTFDLIFLFWYFIYVGNSSNSLDIQNQILFWAFITTSIISLYPLMPPHRQDMGESFVLKFFHRE